MSDSNQSTPGSSNPAADSGATPAAPPLPVPDLPEEDLLPEDLSPEELLAAVPPAATDLSELPDLPEDCGIRETLLWRFERPEDEAALRRLGSMLGDLLAATGQAGPETAGGRPPGTTRQTVRAVALDLFYAARSLSEVADGATVAGSAPERSGAGPDRGGSDGLLVEASAAWSAHATLLAAGILEALEGPPS